jgi:hypothetical protein
VKLIGLSGRAINKPVQKYLINWKKKCRSKFQKGVKDFLYTFWKNQIVYEEFPVAGTRMTIDFFNLSAKIAIEVQGEQHRTPNKHFHNGDKMNFYAQIERDMEKKKYCELNGWRMFEIYPEDMPLTQEFLEKHNII